jgi:hypothetical protein
MRSKVGEAMDTPALIIIVLSVITAIVWADSWILGSANNREDQPEQRATPLYHGEAMLGVEEF